MEPLSANSIPMPDQDKQPDVSMNDLAAMVKRGFDGVQNSFDEVFNRLAQKADKQDMEELSHELQQTRHSLEVRVDALETRVVRLHENRLDRLEAARAGKDA